MVESRHEREEEGYWGTGVRNKMSGVDGRGKGKGVGGERGDGILQYQTNKTKM